MCDDLTGMGKYLVTQSIYKGKNTIEKIFVVSF